MALEIVRHAAVHGAACIVQLGDFGYWSGHESEPPVWDALRMFVAPRRVPLYEQLLAGPMFDGWHWLAWHFGPRQPPFDLTETKFAAEFLDALLVCDQAMPGYAAEMLKRLGSFGGSQRQKNQDDFESIRQLIAEVLVVLHFVTWDWALPVKFEHEPTVAKGGRNPEINIVADQIYLGIEVKTPNLRVHAAKRHSNAVQLLARLPSDLMFESDTPTRPRDNPVKDFLSDADKKFAGFRKADPRYRSVLAIVWDDYINEPISALLSPMSGLFTPNSFAVGADDKPIKYSNVDAVVILRDQDGIADAAAGKPPRDDRSSFLDYGSVDKFPFNSLILNPHGEPLTPRIIDALQALPPQSMLGAEYVPSELVFWWG